jgi:RNA-splicing ligase RtcB
MDSNDEESLQSTLEHIERISARIASLTRIQEQAETQLAHRVGTLARSGRITRAEALGIYRAVQRVAHEGKSLRWNQEMPKGFTSSSLMVSPERDVNYEPNGPGGTWLGTSMHSYPAPTEGQCVVYVLYDTDNVPCYVGSTMQFKTRMRQHRRSGKKWVAWRAMPCADRTEAYEREREMLREYAPYLNKAM